MIPQIHDSLALLSEVVVDNLDLLRTPAEQIIG